MEYFRGSNWPALPNFDEGVGSPVSPMDDMGFSSSYKVKSEPFPSGLSQAGASERPPLPPARLEPEASDSVMASEAEAQGDVVIDELTGVAQAEVEKHQNMYVRYEGSAAGHIVREWRQQDSCSAIASAFPHEEGRGTLSSDLPLSCTLKIIQAPAAYARPMVHKKVFRPAFKVRMELRYKGALNLRMELQASPIADAGFAKPDLFTDGEGDSGQQVQNNVISRAIRSPAADAETEKTMDSDNLVEEKMLVEDFEFTNLKFVKSSRMFKRWLVFHCKIKNDTIYCIYDLPSVIVSRRNDQYGKAYALLMGTPPPVKRQRVPSPAAAAMSTACSSPSVPNRMGAQESLGMRRMTVDQACTWIENQYLQSLPGVMRGLSPEDKLWLVKKAGLDPTSSEPSLIPVHRWTSFEDWYSKCLDALRAVIDIWDQSEPEIICGLSVDRSMAERALKSEPPGTFLVRLCSEPGCFAVSTRVKQGNQCDHLLLDRVDLQRRSLLKWIEAHEAAQLLLHISTGIKFPKETIISTGFFRLPSLDHLGSSDFPAVSLSGRISNQPQASQGMMEMEGSVNCSRWDSNYLPGGSVGMGPMMGVASQMSTEQSLLGVGTGDSMDLMNEMLAMNLPLPTTGQTGTFDAKWNLPPAAGRQLPPPHSGMGGNLDVQGQWTWPSPPSSYGSHMGGNV
mmetsp:Transcript_31429/g.89224  ORF Transcript_31429/g.89224 Transcript_31429/m.89224 type:complete len:678 (+) Transcript_31429:216-2249(+)